MKSRGTGFDVPKGSYSHRMARDRTYDLSEDEGVVVGELMRFWGILSDLGFSDLMLCIPTSGAYVISAQVRPATAQTLHPGDLVGMHFDLDPLSPIARSLRTGRVTFDSRVDPRSGRLIHSQYFPLTGPEGVYAVLQRDRSGEQPRQAGVLEQEYLNLFDRFTQMLLVGRFPYPGSEIAETPRVGDGVIVLDEWSRVRFLSPNAVSALHRVGVRDARWGRELSQLGLRLEAVQRSARMGTAVLEEVEQLRGATVLFCCLPLYEGSQISGYLLLLRDVTDLRQQERLLISKDATIREVHHRVKNNLQTISSLLRLQSRRIDDAAAIHALGEAERRIGAMAAVHEVLSRDISEVVEIDEAVAALVAMVRDSVSAGKNLTVDIRGSAGRIAAASVTPIALALAELFQNACEHAFGQRDHLTITCDFERRRNCLVVGVRDDGVGMPAEFDPTSSHSLGLAIVRDVVTGQLAGSFEIASRPGEGTTVLLSLPMAPEEEAAEALEPPRHQTDS